MQFSAVLLVIVGALATAVSAQRCNGGATCVLLEACPVLYNQLRHGNTPELTRLLRSLHCGFEQRICCPPSTDNSGGDQSSKLALLPSFDDCGTQNNDRIVGGVATDIDEHPWMALLRYDKPRGWGFYCGGVLISARYVMTAAHCVKGSDFPKTWTLTQVRLGEHDTGTDVDCVRGGTDCAPAAVDVNIQKIIPHEGYVPEDSHQQNDIALLRLERNVRITDFVKPICLPRTEQLKRDDFKNYVVEVAGWGKTESRSESDVKLKVRVPIMNNDVCGDTYRRVDRRISSKQVCAGGQAGRDSCRGDSGGPLMAHVLPMDKWVAAGIVSYGPTPCGMAGWPGVYTKVSAYVDWIVSKLEP